MPRQRNHSPNKKFSFNGPNSKGDYVKLISLVGFIILAFATLGIALYFQPEGFDEKTYCPESGHSGVTAILVDISDEPTTSQIARFESEFELENLLEGFSPLLSKGGKLVVYSLTVQDKPNLIFDLCHPGDPNKIYEGDEIVKRRWDKFSNEISDKVVPLMFGKPELRKSPIVESIKFIKERHFSHISPNDSEKYKLVIWSDMLQNGDEVSHFNKELKDVNSVRNRYPFRLDGVDIYLFYLTSKKHFEYQSEEHQEWWKELFKLTKGNLNPLEVL